MKIEITGTHKLGELGHTQCDGDLPDRDIELEPEEAIEEECREAGNLVEAGIVQNAGLRSFVLGRAPLSPPGLPRHCRGFTEDMGRGGRSFQMGW